MSTPVTITSGPWAGWKTWPQSTFEIGAGPFYCCKDGQGQVVSAFIAEPRHMNSGGFMHSGCLLTFSDFACFAIAEEFIIGGAVTINLSGDFQTPACGGDRIEATGEVTRARNRLIFIRGLITANGKPCMSFTSVMSKTNLSRG